MRRISGALSSNNERCDRDIVFHFTLYGSKGGEELNWPKLLENTIEKICTNFNRGKRNQIKNS
jgi:hypothetical protein